MSWKPIGFITVPKTNHEWMHSHCQLPTPLVIDDNKVRVFFASRTIEQRSHIGFVELEFLDKTNWKISHISNAPVLTPGPIGFFDEHGVFPSSIVFFQDQYYLYYIGWNQGVEAPLFYANIGLATSKDGVNFCKYSKAPIMGRSEVDPCLVTSPNVYLDNGIWKMTYVSGEKWERDPHTLRLKSFYNIKNAESEDGITWKRKGTAINFVDNETNIARSSVFKYSDTNYKMWFSYVKPEIGRYRIGFATSKNGSDWERNDAIAGITTDSQYASEMICYPSVFKFQNTLYMLYNGNNFGEKGFGIAVWS